MRLFLLSLSLLTFSLCPAHSQDAPERNARIEEKDWDALSNQNFIKDGTQALEIRPDRWKHGETENFILHYRRQTEARKVAREIEFALWHAAQTLGKTPSDYGPKSHVFIFENEEEWRFFLATTKAPPWAAAFAKGGDLFLEVRDDGSGRFNAPLVAHEVTHSVVHRLYPDKRWPLWLNEGFAEYIGSTSSAARKGMYQKRGQGDLRFAELHPFDLENIRMYPDTPESIAQLYQSSEKFVRFLINQHGVEKFREFVTAVAEEESVREVFGRIYGAAYPSDEEFMKEYLRFTR